LIFGSENQGKNAHKKAKKTREEAAPTEEEAS
jgi:hypothetical protein